MKQQGYTLIELLLVIAILSMISAYAIITVHQNAQQNRIAQTALEMQQVLQAAMAYNAAQNAWPLSNNNMPQCTPTNPTTDPFIQTFLPNQNYISHFGNNFCWGMDSNNPNSLFWVALKMPFSAPIENYNTAQQIAARLPNAAALIDPTAQQITPCTTTSEHCYVRTEIALPTQINGGVVGLGYCDPDQANTQLGSNKNISCAKGATKDQYTISFSCPSGSQGQVYLMPNFYRAAYLGEADPSTIQTTLNAKTQTDTCTETSAGSSQYQCPITITALFDSGSQRVVDTPSGAIGATYIAYCAQSTTHLQKTAW